MQLIHRFRAVVLLTFVLGGGWDLRARAQPAKPPAKPPTPASYPQLPSETPAKYTPSTTGFEYTRREVMIAMRDGVKLFTVILVPRGAKGAPILITRTPYNASELTAHGHSGHLAPILQGYDNATDV